MLKEMRRISKIMKVVMEETEWQGRRKWIRR